VDRKSRKAELLAAEKNKKVKIEFEMIDPIDAQMEATVQDTCQNVIKTRWYIIAEAHKIVYMSMYVKKFMVKELSYLLKNDKMNVAVDVDDDNETQFSH
jgi:uncharacterized DUF497 family protein